MYIYTEEKTIGLLELSVYGFSILCPTAPPPFKMTAVTKNRNVFSCQFLLYYKSKLTQILTAATWQ
jgi:hypothetical protein